jgi:endo-1,4-beta-xylanase
MLKKIVGVTLVATFVLSACAPVVTPAPTMPPAGTAVPPTPTAIASTLTAVPPTLTAAPRPTTKLTQNATLYAGPGNADFDSIATLGAGETVYPVATFGDFVQGTATVNGQESTGFIWKQALGSLPAGLPELTGDQAPWQPLYQPKCSPGAFDAAQDVVTFSNPGTGYYDTESGAIALSSPLKIGMRNAKVEGATSAAIKILGIPEPSSGNWWQGITRLDVGYSNGHYYLGIRDGQTEPGIYIELPLTPDQGIQLLFNDPAGKSFRVLDGNGQSIQSVDLTATSGLSLPNGLFPNGVAYIGTTLPPKSSFTVTGLRVGVLPSGAWVDAQNGYYTQPGLAELSARRGLTIGTEFGVNRTSDPRYCQIMKRDFNVAVLSEFSWQGMWLGPGQYDFSALDLAVDYASKHGWRIRASHLLWGAPEVLPDWLKNGNFSRDQLIQIMEQYIKDIVGRYQGRVAEWSIANEATNRSFSSGADFWNDKIGPEYIALAFKAAREADPNGILIFNEDNNQSPQDAGTTRVVDKMYATVKQLKADGVPVAGVGMQMHLFLPWNSQVPPSKEAVIATMQKFAALGVRIYITEFDVDLAGRPGTQAEKWAFEAQLYRDMMEACLESGVCNSFSTWGISDSTSWITCAQNGCVNAPTADPLMFDGAFNPKPAYFAVRDALLTDFTVAPTVTPTK